MVSSDRAIGMAGAYDSRAVVTLGTLSTVAREVPNTAASVAMDRFI